MAQLVTQNLTGKLGNDRPAEHPLNDPTVQALDAPNFETSEPDRWIGKPLGNYVIEKLLGAGGMGRVYQAKHRWLDSPAAIKLLNPVLDGEPEAILRFQREARIAAKLNHPNIVKATDGGPIENSFYIATELVDGDDLSDLVRRNGPLSIELASWLIREVAFGLDHAHRAGLIHRDIKPSNIMLPREGTPKLLDLGLARYADSATNLTSTGQFMGTIDYVSPEQATDTRAVDGRADIYSLGCTFYFLLTGSAPYEGQAYDTAVSKILAHAEEDPTPIMNFRRDVPAAIIKIIEKAMAKDACNRFQTAGELADQLERFADSSGAQALFDKANQPSIAPRSQPPKVTLSDRIEGFSDSILKIMWIGLR